MMDPSHESPSEAMRTAEVSEALLTRVVLLAREAVDAGGIPFAAIALDREGNVLGSGINRVATDGDPTAHAEIVALREAEGGAGRQAIAGATLIASGEPCGMCYGAALSYGVSRIVFVADRDEAAVHGFDYRRSYEEADMVAVRREIAIEKRSIAAGLEPFLTYLRRAARQGA